MKKITLLLSIPVVLSLLVFLSSFRNAKEETVTWYTMEEAIEMSAKGEKKIFVDVYTDWCGWCKRMDATTFKDEKVAKLLNEKFIPVKFNAEAKRDITAGDKTYKFVPNGRRGYHELAAEMLNGRMSYPTVVLLTEQLQMIQPIPGYKDAKDMSNILEFIGNDIYKTTTWDDFVASRVGQE